MLLIFITTQALSLKKLSIIIIRRLKNSNLQQNSNDKEPLTFFNTVKTSVSQWTFFSTSPFWQMSHIHNALYVGI